MTFSRSILKFVGDAPVFFVPTIILPSHKILKTSLRFRIKSLCESLLQRNNCDVGDTRIFERISILCHYACNIFHASYFLAIFPDSLNVIDRL